MVQPAPPPNSKPSVVRAWRVEQELGRYIIGMSEEIHGALLALAARQHVFLLGTPGGGKSLLASEVCRRIRGAAYYKIQLDAAVTKEELFGLPSIRAMKERDSISRKVKGNLPGADVAQLDEIWKCPPMILHTLLTILNEREYRNDEQVLRAPLVSAFVTSNETPATDRSLEALYDRILLRYQVTPLRQVEDRQKASRFRLRMRAFEAEARRIAAQLAESRELDVEAEIDAITREFEARVRREAETEVRARFASRYESVALMERGALNAERDTAINQRLWELEREQLPAIDAQIAELRADSARLAIDTPGSEGYLPHPDRWLIDWFGEIFSAEDPRATLEAARLPRMTPDQELLLRRMVDWVAGQEPRLELPYATFLTRSDIDELHALTLAVTIPPVVEESFYKIIDSLPSSDQGRAVSVRRETELRMVVAASAALAGRREASIEDLGVLVHALWDRPEQIAQVRRIVEEETGNREELLAALRATVDEWARADAGDLPGRDGLRRLTQMDHELAEFERAATIHAERDDVREALAAARGAREAFARSLAPSFDDEPFAPVPRR